MLECLNGLLRARTWPRKGNGNEVLDVVGLFGVGGGRNWADIAITQSCRRSVQLCRNALVRSDYLRNHLFDHSPPDEGLANSHLDPPLTCLRPSCAKLHIGALTFYVQNTELIFKSFGMSTSELVRKRDR